MSFFPQSKQADYGQDAPGVRILMFAIAAIGLAISIAGFIASIYWTGIPFSLVAAIELLGALVAIYGVGMGTYMTWASKVGKLRTCHDLLERAGQPRPWKGDEVVIDVGCGRGLMLIGAAKRLNRGTAIGFDIWRERDQSNNSPGADHAHALVPITPIKQLHLAVLQRNREGF